jgi:chromate transporter
VSAAVIGIAERSITDIPTVLIALTAIVLLEKFKKSPAPIVVIAAAAMGLIIYPLLHSHS